MSNIIPLEKIFHYQGREVRTIIKDDEILFLAKDACDVLDITNYRDAVSRLDENEKITVAITDTHDVLTKSKGQTNNTVGITDSIRGNPNRLYVTEPGFYGLTFDSRKPEAKAIRRWLKHEVMPSIRKTGEYKIPPLAKSITQIPSSMNRYLDMSEQQKIDALNKLMEDTRNLEYSVQNDELHLQMKLICFHAFGILNNWNAPLEENDKLLLELLQMRLDIQEQHTKSFNHTSVEQRIQDFVQTHMKPVVFRLR